MQVSVHVILAVMDISSKLQLSLKVILKVQKHHQHNNNKTIKLFISYFTVFQLISSYQ